ncbi:rRNA-processing protein utp21 [Coemansia sp. RSA 2559]|nr:rRNA-processing protein utp21 [Coemansia sp. RSA 2559]
MVDCFGVESVAVSLALSPTGDFLASTHMDSVGVFLWASRAQFADVTLRRISPEDADAAALVAMPTSGASMDEAPDAGNAEASNDAVYLSAEKLTDNMVTLSSQPRSKWQTLLNLALIKKRNAPQRPPQAPEHAPFFLPTAEGVEHRFDFGAPADRPAAAPSPDAQQQSKIVSTASAQSGLARMLIRAQEAQTHNGVFDYLKQLAPSAVDVEIRTLPLDDGLKTVGAFIRAATAQLRSKRDFELAQAYVHVFLGVFADVIKANIHALEPLLADLRKESRAQWASVDGLVRFSACMVEYMRSSK